MEGFYAYLYGVSTSFLGIIIILNFLPQATREKCHLNTRESKSFGWSVLSIAFFLGTISIVYFAVEFRIVQISFTLPLGSSAEGFEFFLMKVNSVLAFLLIFLELIYLYKSNKGELYYPAALEGLYEMGKMHIFTVT